ncbi:glycosyltransferase [Acuticoccus kandeliae]|uniref:glycosyltransferase n=1 Tax=Acuticoccus kandeliae TaxID=2073160 RepID=UPI001300375D|nr:glycosyltransferase [Acuticoccus kandeliae]
MATDGPAKTPRITYVTMAPPRPARNGYAVRIQTIGNVLARHSDLRFLVLQRGHDETSERATRERFAADFVDAPPQAKWQKGLIHAMAAATNRNRWMEKYGMGALCEATRAAIEAHKPDVVVLGSLSIYSIKDRLGLTDQRIIIDHHNVESVNYDRMAATRKGPSRIAPMVDARAFRKLEHDVAGVREHWAVSDTDRALLERIMGVEILTVPNVAQPSAFEIDPKGTAPDAPPVIGFMANYEYYPNVEAAFELFRIVPMLREDGPSFEAFAMGAHPSEALKAGAAEAGVTMTGFVDDPRPLFERFSLLLAPIRSGGGTKLKILEALAMGLPVVTTEMGSEGIPIAREDIGIIAESNADLAAACRALLGDRARLAAMGARARTWARSNASLDVLEPTIAASMARIAEDVAAGKLA